MGHPKGRGLVGDLKKKQAALRRCNLAWNDADDELITAQAECDLQREVTNETIEDLQITLEGVVGKKWSDPLYKACFPNGLTAFKDADAEAYATKLLPGLIDTIKDSGERALKKYLAPLKKAVTGFQEPLAGLAVARKQANSADLKLRKAKIEWLDAYAALEGSFNATFPRRKRFVASFFPQGGGPAKKPEAGAPAPAGGAPAPAPAPAPGPTPATGAGTGTGENEAA